MHDILLKHTDEKYISCEIDGLKLTYTFSDDPKYHTVAILRNRTAYIDLKNEIYDIYNSYENKDDGYIVACETLDTVECDEYFVEDSKYCYCDIRDREEIDDYLDEATDKVWLMRNCDIPRKRVINEAAIPSMKRILESYDDIPDDGYDTWECGYWNGIMATLRWVLGDEKDFLDT